MDETPYRELARRLDAFPIGFPATESGVELRLLARLFDPDQAALAAVMTPACEPAAAIAARAGLDPAEAESRLRAMVRLGLIRAQRGADPPAYGLSQFIGAVYESQLARMDAEMAGLFEEYYRQTGGAGAVDLAPAVQRVIPVEAAIPLEAEILPYERASDILALARSWGVRDCICRVQQRLVGRGCQHPVDVCLLFAPVEGAFDDSPVDRAITLAEAQAVLRRAAEAGLVHSVYNFRGPLHHICSCCTCGCLFLRGVAEFGRLSAVAHSLFHAVVDPDLCTGCGECLGRCQFGALSLPDDVCLVDPTLCMGCGQCVATCPTQALRLERLPADEAHWLPADRGAWAAQRQAGRGRSGLLPICQTPIRIEA